MIVYISSKLIFKQIMGSSLAMQHCEIYEKLLSVEAVLNGNGEVTV